jgi:hypothetical protein
MFCFLRLVIVKLYAKYSIGLNRIAKCSNEVF